MGTIKVRAVMRDGSVVRFRVKSITVVNDGLGQFKRVEWVSAWRGPTLMRLDVDRVTSITTRRWLW